MSFSVWTVIYLMLAPILSLLYNIRKQCLSFICTVAMALAFVLFFRNQATEPLPLFEFECANTSPIWLYLVRAHGGLQCWQFTCIQRCLYVIRRLFVLRWVSVGANQIWPQQSIICIAACICLCVNQIISNNGQCLQRIAFSISAYQRVLKLTNLPTGNLHVRHMHSTNHSTINVSIAIRNVLPTNCDHNAIISTL